MAARSPPLQSERLSDTSDAHISRGTSDPSQGQTLLRLRPPRSLPPWIDSYEPKSGEVHDDLLRLLRPPARSVRPQHNVAPTEPQRRVSKDGFVDLDDVPLGAPGVARGHIPHFLRYGRASRRGRKWDHLRSPEPVIVPGYIPSKAQQPSLTWSEFIRSSAWAHMPNEEAEVVDPEAFNKLQPTFDRPVDVPPNPLDPRASRRKRTLAFSKRLWHLIIRHSLAPLIFRLTVMLTSILALGVACRIFELNSAVTNSGAERTQSVVAIAVDSVAIPYLAYMIWDEYTGKPLGLRSGVSKISIVLLDLFFIIFSSASTALAFESLVYHTLSGHEVKAFATVLAAFELVGLIAWTMNLTVNIFRTVERLGGGEDDGMR